MNTHHEELKKQIGQRFRQMRKHVRLSQTKLARVFKMHQSNIARIEMGIISPNLSLMSYFRNQFRINLNWLITGKGDMVLKEGDLSGGAGDYGEYENEVKDMLFHLENVPEVRYPVLKLFSDYKLEHKKEIFESLQKSESQGG